MPLTPEQIKAIADRAAGSILASKLKATNPTRTPREKALWSQGEEIARKLDNGVGYRGPWLPFGPDGEFVGHYFNDDAVTQTSLVCQGLEDCKADLIRVRKEYKAEPPVFTAVDEEAPRDFTIQENVNPCPNLQPMAEWIKGETPGTCRPCTLAPVVQWYWQELKERGLTDIAAELEAEVDVLEEDNVEQVMALCKDLDEIKANAPEELRKRLEEFDCAIQSFDPAEISDEVQSGDLPASSQPHAHTRGTE